MIREPDWSNPKLTMGDIYSPAMAITDPSEAARYLEKIVDYVTLYGGSKKDREKPREEHIRIQKSNLGYYAGYFDAETMARVNNAFNCVHPIFGGTMPTAEEAFEAGRDTAERAKRGAKLHRHEQPKDAPKRREKKVRNLILSD